MRSAHVFATCNLILFAAAAPGAIPPNAYGQARLADDLTVKNIQGDWIVKDHQRIHGQDITLNGSLVLEPGSTLELDGCSLKIIGTKSREHLVDWRGGHLVTRNTVIGGAIHQGRAIHTVFHLYDGDWDAIDTTVQYAYGVSFNPGQTGRLRAKRLVAGPRPDAIIASGAAEIELEDCRFPIALGIYTNAGGSATLDLPIGRPVTKTFDKSNVPGATYRMQLTNHVVSNQWFIFLRRVSMDAPPCEIVLRDCPKVLLSLLSWNVEGELTLTDSLDQPVRIGNVALRRADKPVGITMWSLYGGGPKYNLTIRGKDARIAEFMHRGGRVRLLGNAGSDGFNIACTTLEMSGNAQLELEHVRLGRPPNWTPSKAMGEVNLADDARITGHGVAINRVVFHTRDRATVQLTAVRREGAIEKRAEGGPILIEPANQ